MKQKTKRRILVTYGIGEGQTEISAFDAALWDAGIADFNLIILSSIIPPNTTVTTKKQNDKSREDHFGKKLYVVLSKKREHEKGRVAWAGLGWVQTKDGRGLFVEQAGAQKAEVVRLIKETLEDMVKYRKDRYGEIYYRVAGILCRDKPVCALVAASYQMEDWV